MTVEQFELDFDRLMKFVSSEAKDDKEWVCYDDDFLKTMQGNWMEIVGDLSRHGAYPTVLLYERLLTTDKHDFDSTFPIQKDHLDKIVKKALDAERSVEKEIMSETRMQQSELEKFQQLQEAERNNEPFTITWYSFKERRVFTNDYQTEEDAMKMFPKIFEAPKILSRGDAVLRKRNFGADQNLNLLMQTFKDERQ